MKKIFYEIQEYKTLIDAILEIYFNQTDDYDVIADQCGCTVLDVANTLNDYMLGK